MKTYLVRKLQSNFSASLFLLNLALKLKSKCRVENEANVPKKIFSYWAQGVNQAPDIVQLNWSRWRKLNSDYELILLDRKTAESVIGRFPFSIDLLSHQAFSDLLRIKLLADTGGVWVDASLYPLLPLKQWLGSCISNSSFFAFHSPGTGTDRMLSTWFLAAETNCVLMQDWWKVSREYWCKPRKLRLDEEGEFYVPEDPTDAVKLDKHGVDDTYCYFWVHYLFAKLYSENSAFKQEWDNTIKISANPRRALNHLFRSDEPQRPWNIIAVARSGEVQKLDWRNSYPVDLLSKI